MFTAWSCIRNAWGLLKFLLKTMVKRRRSKRRRCPAASLTDDLVVEILCRLPARSVCRFKCVSTTWRDLISVHNRKLPQTLAGVFSAHLLDCCNGLVLCSSWPGPDTGDFQLFVCNPATKKWVELPDSNLGNRTLDCCLGFNPTVSPHFYVFEFFGYRDYDSSLVVGVDVYSSETGQWVLKENNGISYHAHCYPHVFLNNGCVHYLTNDPAIAVVDTQGKACRSIPVPDNEHYGFIQQSQGCLYYANFEADDEDQMVRFVLYVLEDYDNQRWTLKHTAEAFDVLGRESHNLARDFEWVAIHPD